MKRLVLAAAALAGLVLSASAQPAPGPGMRGDTSPAGKLLGFLNLPIYGGEPKKQICATNLAFGGVGRHDLYIAACDDVFRVRLKSSGLR